MSQSLFRDYLTTSDKEVNGVDKIISGVKFVLARAGGSNSEYNVAHMKAIQEFQERVKSNTLTEEENVNLLQTVFADKCVKGIYVRDEDGNWVRGIPQLDGRNVITVEDSIENRLALFKCLPDLFNELYNFATNRINFLAGLEEIEAGN